MAYILKNITPQRDSQAFWLSFFLCLFVCGIILFIIAPITGLSEKFGAGNDGYIQLARNLVAGNGYVFEKGGPAVFHRPPLYPLFLMPVALFPENLQRYIIVIPQSILVGFIGMMVFKIASRLYNGNVAKIALLIFLINPWVYWNAKTPMTPVLQTFMYIIFAYFSAVELFDEKKFKVWISGVIIGFVGAALALTHAAKLPLVCSFIFIIFIFAVIRNKGRILTPIFAGFIVICLISLWTYRNWVTFHKFIPIAGGGSLAYFNGNVHWSGIEPHPQEPDEDLINASLRVMGIQGTEKTVIHWKGFKDIKDENIANEKMIQNIRNHPFLFAEKFFLDAVEYYFPAITKPFLAIKVLSKEQYVLTIFHLILWTAAVFGIIYDFRAGFLFLTGIILYAIWYFPFATFIGHLLYTMGTIPFLSILAASGIVRFPIFSNCPS